MILHDVLAPSVPHVIGDVVVCPNTFGLPVTVEWKHPEHIVEKVEHALPKNENRGCGAILRRSEKARVRILESIDRRCNSVILFLPTP